MNPDLLDSSHTFRGTHRSYHHCTYYHPHLIKKKIRNVKEDSDWLVFWKINRLHTYGGLCMNLPVPAVQALHPAERLQLLLPTLTFRSLQASFLLLWYVIKTRKKVRWRWRYSRQWVKLNGINLPASTTNILSIEKWILRHIWAGILRIAIRKGVVRLNKRYLVISVH